MWGWIEFSIKNSLKEWDGRGLRVETHWAKQMTYARRARIKLQVENGRKAQGMLPGLIIQETLKYWQDSKHWSHESRSKSSPGHLTSSWEDIRTRNSVGPSPGWFLVSMKLENFQYLSRVLIYLKKPLSAPRAWALVCHFSHSSMCSKRNTNRGQEFIDTMLILHGAFSI